MNNSITIWDDLAIISLNYNSAKEVFRQVSSLREEGIPDVCFPISFQKVNISRI